ncbi:MAG: molybdenum cofactor guanylyltransferase [Deltaproteobacteria bacterium]|nr:molybdenum cofactor guanylyltransferase [Deltaproteobacteria bacterium]
MMTGIILAGGESKRMGFNKAFIEMGGMPLIERTVSLFTEVFSEVIIVSNNLQEYEHLNLMVVSDIVNGKGSLGGIYTGLIHSTHPYCFVVACDMPFLHKGLITHMIGKLRGYDVVVPFIDGRYESLHAVYSKGCVKHIEKSIKEDNLKIVDFYPRVRVKTIQEEDCRRHDPLLLFRTNINTIMDLERIREVERLRQA